MIRILTFSTLYPSSVRPGHGIFVETRLRELVSSGEVEARVVAPVPWFFSTNPKFGEYARIARTPLRQTRNGFDVQYPRYFLPPAIGMNIAPFLLAMGALPAVKHLIDAGYDFDVIDAHYYYPDGVAAAILARHFKKPFTVTARGSDINLISKHLIPRKLMGWAAERASASIGVSAALTDAMRQLGMPVPRLRTMPNGVDMTLFRMHPQRDARAALGWADGPTLLSVGNLVENKGHHIAIESLVQLPEFRLAISGEGPQRQALEQLANKLGVSQRLTFLGRVDQVHLAVCYSAADILVLPSSREGWPNVLLESMACGTPVVATRVGGIPEIVNSAQAGRLISARNASSLVEGILALWRNLPDKSDVRLIAQANSWQRTTDAQLVMFSQIVSVTTRSSAAGSPA